MRKKGLAMVSFLCLLGLVLMACGQTDQNGEWIPADIKGPEAEDSSSQPENDRGDEDITNEEESEVSVQHDRGDEDITNEEESEASVQPKDFIRAQGRILVDGEGKEFLIKGISFGNNVWSNPPFPPKTHHTEESYRELSQLGFNSVRFYLNYGIFEDDSKPYEYKQSGWDWLDKNIAWAKKYDMRLVLNMHYPQGGFQSNGEAMELWTNRENQLRLIALWKEIARRYRNEPAILAYGILNEPVVAEGATEEETFGKWVNLAKEIVAAIREVDGNHLILVERLCASKNLETGQINWDSNRNGNLNFFLIEDPNIAYEFHFYSPFEFTHQNAGWKDNVRNRFAVYPDEDAIQVKGPTKWEWFTDTSPKADPSASGWQYLEGKPYKVTKEEYMIGKPTLQARNIGTDGSVWFDDVVIKEYDEKGEFVRVVREYSFDRREDWYFWQAGDSKGTGGYDIGFGHDWQGSMKISGTTHDANLGAIGWVPVKQGYSYEVSGYVYCENVAPSAEIRLRLDFYSCESVQVSNKEYLRAELEKYLEFGRKNNVPLYLGEFGTISDSFKEGRGGERWVADMLDILMENKMNFNYHTYHEPAFGLYANPATLYPDRLNTALYEVFKEKLK